MSSISMAQRFLESLAAGHLDDLIAEDAVSWHNLDGVEAPLSTATGSFAAVRALYPDFRYADVRYTVGEEGISLARFTLMADLGDGRELRAPGCLVVTERDGIITRTEEYLDGRQVAPLAKALGN
jgi:ketosteroid isomerase-like protein